jgi:predicted Holliday junction resolvase-like endonuclease
MALLALVLVLLLAAAVIALVALYRRHRDYQVMHRDYELSHPRSVDEVEQELGRRLKTSTSVRRGQDLQYVAPWLVELPGRPGDERFLGSPIDLVIFERDDLGKIDCIHFWELKTGKNGLNAAEREVKAAVEAGRVKFGSTNVDRELGLQGGTRAIRAPGSRSAGRRSRDLER